MNSPQTTASNLEKRKRLKDDYAYYAKHCVKIRTKDGTVEPLVFNTPQSRLDAKVEELMATQGRVRIVILKGRQQGFSTWVHGRLYCRLSQDKAKKGLVVAHDATSTRALFDMYRNTHKEMPAAMKASTEYSSRKELVFSKLRSGIMVATAGGEGIARGETISHAHLSEVAFWPRATAEDNLNALLQTIPDKDNTEIYVESTANGMTGVFYELWQGAVAGTNGFVAFFSPWFDTPEYRSPVTEDFELTYEEMDLVERFGLDKEQLQWRRYKVAASGIDKFHQEYPSTAEEAFIASGSPVFNPDQLHTMLQDRTPILKTMTKELSAPTFEDHPRGQLTVFHEKDPGETYYIGADVAQGLKDRDWSVAQVLDSQKRQVAVWRGHVDPDYYAEILFALGTYYNTARICVENNNHGILTAVRLGRDLAYENTYTEVGEGQLNDRETITIGFRTTEKSKPLIIDRLRAALRLGELQINCETTLKEMLGYVVTENGKMTAEVGKHDDCVMSLAFANHIHDGKFTPIQVTDDYYVTAL